MNHAIDDKDIQWLSGKKRGRITVEQCCHILGFNAEAVKEKFTDKSAFDHIHRDKKRGPKPKC